MAYNHPVYEEHVAGLRDHDTGAPETGSESLSQLALDPDGDAFSGAELGALAHLYRGEIYRSTIWRTRLDNTTNWAVVSLGVALSIVFSSPEASAIPLLLVGLLVMVFLVFEARRYRYFTVWRARARWLETHFYGPLLLRQGQRLQDGWSQTLARDYHAPEFHISMARAIGRRLRRNYVWILGIQALAYVSKILAHPTALASADEFWARAAVGPVPGSVVIAAGACYNLGWVVFALVTWRADMRDLRERRRRLAMG